VLITAIASFVNKDEVAIKKRAEINVFTVASGLLYEVGNFARPSMRDVTQSLPNYFA
jgi:hypothetical protein